jgi:hypothetical protein
MPPRMLLGCDRFRNAPGAQSVDSPSQGGGDGSSGAQCCPTRFRLAADRPPRRCGDGALYALLVSLGATKMMAEQVMQDFPRHERACQAIADFASDGESDIRGTIALLDDWDSWQQQHD